MTGFKRCDYATAMSLQRNCMASQTTTKMQSLLAEVHSRGVKLLKCKRVQATIKDVLVQSMLSAIGAGTTTTTKNRYMNSHSQIIIKTIVTIIQLVVLEF